MTNLANTLEEVRRRIRRLGSRPMNEENTKATLIEPVLRAHGWDVEDVEEVQREFKTHSRHKPVDYGLLVVRTPSAAAVAAVKSVTGTERAINGWDFWQVAMPDGGHVPLGSFRSAAPNPGQATG